MDKDKNWAIIAQNPCKNLQNDMVHTGNPT